MLSLTASLFHTIVDLDAHVIQTIETQEGSLRLDARPIAHQLLLKPGCGKSEDLGFLSFFVNLIVCAQNERRSNLLGKLELTTVDGYLLFSFQKKQTNTGPDDI